MYLELKEDHNYKKPLLKPGRVFEVFVSADITILSS
jgi:hypothetical protein